MVLIPQGERLSAWVCSGHRIRHVSTCDQLDTKAYVDTWGLVAVSGGALISVGQGRLRGFHCDRATEGTSETPVHRKPHPIPQDGDHVGPGTKG